MKFFALCSAILPLAIVNASILPRQTHQHFSVEHYGLNGTTLSGEINAPEGTSAIEVIWAVGDAWQPTTNIKITSGWHNQFQHIAFFYFSGEAPGATQFYLKGKYMGNDIYAPGNFVNYQIKQ
ncbi:hypothetical protein ABW20_dc0101034 [Dactylellina cionopaga]|nr:hypothetical protein ABW20_dc0101034 [Dactylellina cionopaga]